MVTTQAIATGDPVLVEQPLMSTPKPSAGYSKVLRSFAARFRRGDGSSLSSQLVELLALRWFPVLRAFAAAPAEVRGQVVALQTDFADPSSEPARAVAYLAAKVHGSGLFRGGASMNKDELPAGGEALSKEDISRVLTSMMVNAADTMPDGSEAVFYLGALLEHSCAPNVKFCICSAEDAPEACGVSHLRRGSWVGVWKALRPIKAGEAATVSYLEDELLAQSFGARRRMLSIRMSFHCCCSRCRREDRNVKPVSVALPQDIGPAVVHLSELD